MTDCFYVSPGRLRGAPKDVQVLPLDLWVLFMWKRDFVEGIKSGILKCGNPSLDHPRGP